MSNPSTGSSSTLKWFKSSHSTNEGPECVEVAFAPETIHIRDSKRTQGPQLAFGARQWADFVSYAANH
ncbi:DUF397 domain-containing protein [Streptomyces sp. enrichment culture]|uniref:DUF397 domain-containing protein n=1 Tax=Streptomyces sp. enrichment culture TaxID=1795815 RepID=UPI003F542E8B